MLTARQLDLLPEPVLDLYRRYEQSVLDDIARRLAGLDFARPTAAWQAQRLSESGALYDDILKRLSEMTGKSETVLRQMFQQAGVRAMKFDDSVYRAAGLDPLPLNLSPAMVRVLAAGLAKTGGQIRNLTMTTALSGQEAFIRAADLIYMQITTGALDYQSALRAGIKQVASEGLTVVHFSGRRDQLDVALRRTVLTGVNQTASELSWARADEMGCDLVQVSAHAGARPSHAVWQGKIFSRSGTHPRYPDFRSSTGYGTATGLGGINCRHSFYPFFEGISENAYEQAALDEMADKTVKYNGKELSQYGASQVQRAIERKIRKAKRQASALEAAGLDATQERAQVKALQAEMRSFVKQTGLQRQSFREQVYN